MGGRGKNGAEDKRKEGKLRRSRQCSLRGDPVGRQGKKWGRRQEEGRKTNMRRRQ